MLYVNVPKEIKEYKEKIISGFTLRNLVWAISGFTVSIISYNLFKFFIGTELASYLSMFLVVPLFACGFLEVNGMPFDQYLKLVIHYYLTSQILKYENIDGWIETFKEKEKSDVSNKEKRKYKKQLKNLTEKEG